MLTVFRIFFYKGGKLQITPLDVLIMVYLLFAFVSLMGSSEFVLSLKGFIKIFLYVHFYFCFLKNFQEPYWQILQFILFAFTVKNLFNSLIVLFLALSYTMAELVPNCSHVLHYTEQIDILFIKKYPPHYINKNINNSVSIDLL